jgi:Fe-S oxidoreductase/nitrate reductase gamma subunit
MTTEAIPAKTKTPNRYSEAIKAALPRIGDLIVHAFGQVRILKKIYPGIMHQLIFWGVTIQIIGTAINLMQMALFLPFAITVPRGNWYFAYEFLMDLAGVFILIGVSMAAYRRLATKPSYLGTRWDDYYALIILFILPIVGFTTESMRLISAAPEWANWSFAGNIVAGLYRLLGVTPEIAFSLQPVFLLTHIALGLTFVASIPFTKLRHLVAGPLHLITHPRRELGQLEKIEDIEETEVLGVGDIKEFSSQELLSFDACLNCGRCEDVCPATIAGMDYSPRTLITDLREVMATNLISPNGNGSKELVGEIMGEHDLWSCTTCGACLTRCPVFINPPERVVDLRRYQILSTGEMPKSVGDTMRNMERQGNPWGMPPEERISWADGLDVRELAPGDEVDVLLYLGCAGAYDERNKSVSQALVKLLQAAEIDFGILGLDEMCCGETTRRMGHEYLFQVFAEQNIEMFEQVKFKRIVTNCPHCFNTLKNEYPQMGGEYEVQHATQLLAENSGNLPAFSPNGNGVKGQVSYHDSCYLGRYNEVYDQPRKLLDQAKVSRIELERKGENSFCCGGGGGHMWLETDPNTRINAVRLQEAVDAQTDVVATACPYCLIMFDDAIRSKGAGEEIQVLDIAEVLAKQLEG